MNELVEDGSDGVIDNRETGGATIAAVSLAKLRYDRATHPSRTQTDGLQDKQLEDYRDVIGQQHIKRALTIAAAGMHNILLIGPRAQVKRCS